MIYHAYLIEALHARMQGNRWTTLAPAFIPEPPCMPSAASARAGKGWGCVVFDTYLDGTVSAASAIQQISGPTISGVRWVQVGAGKRAIGFTYDKSGGGTIKLRVVPANILNEGIGGGRPAVKRDAGWSDATWPEWSF